MKDVEKKLILYLYETSNFIAIRKIKEAKELEKVQRGEVIKQVCNTQTRKVSNTRERKYKNRKRRIHQVDNDNVCTVNTYRGLRPFLGIGKLHCIYCEL